MKKYFLIAIYNVGQVKSCFVEARNEMIAVKMVTESMGRSMQILRIQRIKKSTFLYMKRTKAREMVYSKEVWQ